MILRKPTKLSLLLRRIPVLSDGPQLLHLRCSSAELLPDHRRRPPQEQPRRQYPRRGSVPLYVLLRSPTIRRFHRLNREISVTLSHSAPFCDPQEALRMRPGHDCNGFCSVSGRSDSDSESESVSESESDDRKEKVLTSSGVDSKELENVCQVIDELFALDRNMESVLDQTEIHLSSDLVVAVLDRFRHARKPAFRFFCWAGQRPGFAHDSQTYNAMMTILGKTRQFETMVSVLEEMSHKKLLNLETLTIAIRAFASAKERKKAVAMFELMGKHDFEPSIEAFNSLLDALGRAKLVKEAQVLAQKLRDRFIPNLQTYTVLLNGWCKVKNLVEAGRLWNEMTDSGFQPDIVAHNIMIGGLLRAKKRSDAIKLFMVMKSRSRPAPNVKTYTIMIRDFAKQGQMDCAMEYFDEMVGSGIEPDLAVYTCLVTGFGNRREIGTIHEILGEMKGKGLPLDSRLYNSLIRMMTRRRMPDEAAAIYHRMVRARVGPTVHTYNMIMRSYFLCGNFEMGREVWARMGREGFCRPDENSYAVLIGGLVREGKAGEACRYLEEMLERGMRAPTIDYGKFAADFCRAGKVDVLEEMARRMRSAGKFEVSGVFAQWAEVAKKRRLKVKRLY